MKKIIIGIIVILLVIFGAQMLSEGGESDDQSLKIGVISPLSGDYAAVGENTVNGIKIAVKHYAEDTGLKVDLVVEDDEGDASKGLSAFRKLEDVDKVDGLINFITATMDSIYNASEVADYPVMMVAFQANNVADDHVFQTTPGNDGTWSGYAEYVKNSDYDLDTFVLVHSPDAAQMSFAESFADSFGKDNITLVEASSDKANLRTDATKIAGLNPTSVLLMMSPEAGAILTKELLVQLDDDTRLLYDIQLITGTHFYIDQLGGDLSPINGSIGLSVEGVMTERYINDYKEMFGTDPGFVSEYAYDTMITYLESHDEDESVWTENIQNTVMDGESGYFAFDDKGIRLPDLAVKEIQNGELFTIDRITVK